MSSVHAAEPSSTVALRLVPATHDAEDRRLGHRAASRSVPSSASRPAPPSAARASTPSRATYRRRRVLVVGALVVVVFAVGVLLGRASAQAGPEDPVGGHVVVEPGQTLWDLAVDTAPDGMDPRQQLADVRELNDLDAAGLDAWSVVLLPAR